MQNRMVRAVVAARLLGVHPRTVVRLVEANELEGIRLGKLTLVRLRSLEKVIGDRIDDLPQGDRGNTP